MSSLASSSTGKPTVSDESTSEPPKTVDQRSLGEEVSLSSTSLFLFKLNTYANSLSDERRHQFADALETSGDPIFSQGFLDSVRYSMSHGGVSVGESVIGNEPASGDHCGVIAMYGGSIPYNGMTVNYLDGYATSGRAQFENALEHILTNTPDNLSQQDSASIQSTFERAIHSSFTSLESDFDIFSVNYQFLIAQDLIDGLDLSDETSSGLSHLLSGLKENNLQANSDSLAQALRDAQKFPGHASKILASAEKTREGIELSNLLQSHLVTSDLNLLDSEEYFTELMQGSKSIESPNVDDYAGLFDYYRIQESQFKRAFIEQNWNNEVVQNNEELIEGQLGAPEEIVSGIASEYIAAVNAYLSTQKHNEA